MATEPRYIVPGWVDEGHLVPFDVDGRDWNDDVNLRFFQPAMIKIEA